MFPISHLFRSCAIKITTPLPLRSPPPLVFYPAFASSPSQAKERASTIKIAGNGDDGGTRLTVDWHHEKAAPVVALAAPVVVLSAPAKNGDVSGDDREEESVGKCPLAPSDDGDGEGEVDANCDGGDFDDHSMLAGGEADEDAASSGMRDCDSDVDLDAGAIAADADADAGAGAGVGAGDDNDAYDPFAVGGDENLVVDEVVVDGDEQAASAGEAVDYDLDYDDIDEEARWR